MSDFPSNPISGGLREMKAFIALNGQMQGVLCDFIDSRMSHPSSEDMESYIKVAQDAQVLAEHFGNFRSMRKWIESGKHFLSSTPAAIQVLVRQNHVDDRVSSAGLIPQFSKLESLALAYLSRTSHSSPSSESVSVVQEKHLGLANRGGGNVMGITESEPLIMRMLALPLSLQAVLQRSIINIETSATDSFVYPEFKRGDINITVLERDVRQHMSLLKFLSMIKRK